MTSLWLQLLVGIVVPALLIAFVPRRWLLRTMVCWLVSPLILYVVLVFVEVVLRKACESSIGQSFYGLMLVTPVLVIPWLLMCLAGFGLGLGIRRFTAPALDRPALKSPVALHANPTPAQPDKLWRAVHVGFANDGLEIGNLGVWIQTWRATTQSPVELPHPQHPTQLHLFNCYEIAEERHVVRFAAAEVSNGVWAFYVPVYPSLAEQLRGHPVRSWAAWRTALVLLVGGLVAIAIASYVSVTYEGVSRPAVQKLQQVPPLKLP